MNNALYHAGVARADITPPVGIRLIGYAVREGFSRAVAEPLTVTALALRGASDEQTVVLLAVDVAVMMLEHAAQVRAACGAALGVPASHILINCNHTHSSPALPGYISYGPPEQLQMEEEYAALFLEKCVQACREAVAALRPARLAAGWGECAGNINRRQKSPEGTMLMGEDPNGVCDRSVGVLRVDDLDGQPIAVAFRYSCHTVTLGPKTNVISPDWAGPARGVVESALDCPSLFLQGCAGNINPATGIGQDADTAPHFDDDQKRLGHSVGGEVLRVAQSLRTHRRRARPRLVQSVAVYWLYEYEPIAPGEAGQVTVREREMQLPLAPFPSLEEVRREREEWAAKLREARERGDSEWVLNPLIRFDRWAQKRLDAAQQGPNPMTVTFPIQTIALGDINLVALPFEPMAETGLALRETLGEHTFVLGYSNGMVSYLPTPQTSDEGGMEARLGYKNYQVPAEVPGSWEPQIRAALAHNF